jgi:aconitase B
MCINQTPCDALQREWGEHGIDGFVKIIAGQEMGTKTQHLEMAAKDKYPAAKVLMIGDAPGDQKAAKSNGALFYPINPGKEEASWERLHAEALDKFFAGDYAVSADDVRARIVKADEDAEYLATFEIDLASVVPMVATPGDPRNGIPLTELGSATKIDIAYGGSCTGGKKADMDMYASVLRGKKVANGVHLYIQFGSQDIRRYAEEKGYLEIFAQAGAELVDPSCGACIKAGPGVSDSPDQVTVSAINRNFPGRSGPGKVYLASPLVVAASAVAGHIVGPDAI